MSSATAESDAVLRARAKILRALLAGMEAQRESSFPAERLARYEHAQHEQYGYEQALRYVRAWAQDAEQSARAAGFSD